MTRPSTAKVSYERLAIDSGYLSDLEEAALKSNDDATALFASASANDGAEFTMSTFEDTDWDVLPQKKAKAAALDKQCRELEAQIKKPTHFPIIPFPSTLARARAEARALHVESSRRTPMSDKKPPRLQRTRREAVVDRCGRTRAAAKRLSAASTGDFENSSEGYGSSPEDAPKRKRQKAEFPCQKVKGLRERH